MSIKERDSYVGFIGLCMFKYSVLKYYCDEVAL